MCTLIVDWNPNNENYITVGANRDERFGRPFEKFDERDNGVFCPLDVRGGTWIGVNRTGLFVALTNRYIGSHKRGMESRGKVVLDALTKGYVKNALSEIGKMDYDKYNPFNLILADSNQLVSVVNYHDRLVIQKLKPGLHSVTADWDIDDWGADRNAYISKEYNGDINVLKKILAYEGDENLKGAVCVTDPNESHKTMSSCIVQGYCKIIDTDIGRPHKVFKGFELHNTYQKPDFDMWEYSRVGR